MATVKIILIHKTKDKSVLQTMADSLEYVVDPKKTKFIDEDGNPKFLCKSDDGITINGAEGFVTKEWDLLKTIYTKITGRNQGSNDILAYHIIQSFAPDEAAINENPELATTIGMELAQELTEGEFPFVVGTHLDKDHVHNHILINSTAKDSSRKYRNIKGSYNDIWIASNEICKNHGLSIVREVEPFRRRSEVKDINVNSPEQNIDSYIETGEADKTDNLQHSTGESTKEPKKKSKYIHWLNEDYTRRTKPEDKKTWQNILCQTVDIILNRDSKYNALSEDEKEKILKAVQQKFSNGEVSGNDEAISNGEVDLRPKSFKDFLEILKLCGYEVKGLDDKYISVRAKGQKKFTRLNEKTLGKEYTKNSIRDYIGKYAFDFIGTKSQEVTKPALKKIIDLSVNSKSGNVGFEKWARLKNLQTLADTHSYLAINNMTYEDVKEMVLEKENIIAELQNQKENIDKHTERQKEISALQNHIVNYVKHRKVFEEYKKGGYNKSFKDENSEVLELYNQARKYFDEYKVIHGIEKMPSMNELKEEYAQLKEIKNNYYDQLKIHKEELKAVKTLQSNTMELLGIDEDGNKLKTEKQIKAERDKLIKEHKERTAKEEQLKKKKQAYRSAR